MPSTDQMARLLLDEDRLAILGRAAHAPCSVDDLAAAITGKRSSLARHLAQLTEAGLLAVSGASGQERYTLDVAHIRSMKQTLFARSDQPTPTDPEEKVLAGFVKQGRLTHIPVHHGKRLIVLRWLANQFDPERSYSEREVNDLLASHGEDHATLRRYLVDAGLLERSAGIYRRTTPPIEGPNS